MKLPQRKAPEAILLLLLATCPTMGFAQDHPPAPTPPPTAPQPPAGTPQGAVFTQLEQVIAQDITEKRQKLEDEFTDFLNEIKAAHPGYMFSNGKLVPIPKTQTTKPDAK